MQTICKYVFRSPLWLWLPACLGLTAFAAEGAPLRVLTTILPIYCFTANVAGSAASVSNLLPEAAEPHDYQLTPGDLRKIAAADLIVINGLGLEDWLGKALRPAGRAPVPVLEASAGLDQRLIRRDGVANPHFWLDPQLAILAVRGIAEFLAKAAPVRAGEFRANAEGYIRRLSTLDDDLEERLAGIRAMDFVAHHDAFPYFARRYGFQIIGLVEMVPDVSPSARELARLLSLIREKRARGMLAEKGESSRLAQQICRDLKLPRVDLNTLEGGPLDLGSYERGMLENAKALARMTAEK